MSEPIPNGKLKLISSDCKEFNVDEEVASQSQMIRNMIEDTGVDAPIPIANVSSEILSKVIEYCYYHVTLKGSTEAKESENKGSKESDVTKSSDETTWDSDFVSQLDMTTLFEIILAANYLNIKALLDLTCRTVANMIKGKTPEEIRKTFNKKMISRRKKKKKYGVRISGRLSKRTQATSKYMKIKARTRILLPWSCNRFLPTLTCSLTASSVHRS